MSDDQKEGVATGVGEKWPPYIGCKLVCAKPMNRGDYNKWRGWEIPSGESADDPGYAIQYPDGYRSWCPEDEFAHCYRTLSAGEMSCVF